MLKMGWEFAKDLLPEVTVVALVFLVLILTGIVII